VLSIMDLVPDPHTYPFSDPLEDLHVLDDASWQALMHKCIKEITGPIMSSMRHGRLAD
jgi:hypothetical protein